MDFIFGVPADARGRIENVIVNRFNKVTHLAPVAVSITAEETGGYFLDILVRHHGLPTDRV